MKLQGDSNRQNSMCRGANQPADNRTDRSSSERDPSGVPATVMNVVNDMMPRRRWRRAMRTMPPMMRRGNRRTSRQNHACHENRNCLDDLVHVTPTFPDFLSLQKDRKRYFKNLTIFSFIFSFAVFWAFSKFSSILANVSYSARPFIAF